MSKFPKLVAGTALATLIALPAFSQTFGLGRAALPEEIAAWDLDVSPDGTGLPEGQGTAEDGEMLFSDNCAACHGEFAEGVDRWPVLAGGFDTLARQDPVKTVGSYWPYLSTVWDYVHRSMPFGNAGTLSADDTYAIVAYILYSNDLIEYDAVLSKETFLDVEMPNADGFFEDDRETAEAAFWGREPCMENCKESVEITMLATVLDVTPDEGGAEEVELAAADTGETATPVEEPAAEPAAEPVEEPVMAAADPELIAEGEDVFKKCKACHKVGEGAKNGTGPMLNGIVGHAAGANGDFKYSGSLADAAAGGLTWTPEELDAFLADPKGYMKGTKMSFVGLKKDEDRQAVIAYLSTFQ
ncbi:c-type cytochrome [Maritimibacter sp. DP1N21-5]|uniref:c-type cytochrome n=1 Tax=Maritimibacter sp. DP1N21-5 TaxID=2836867 RepID=UPI001C451727|nr:c-type cytochrome [Maritimibacter sp. DP1N21-5]MBV7409597.1 c-type cytochrome [Maritimibacter sp. DP1N21-5]